MASCEAITEAPHPRLRERVAGAVLRFRRWSPRPAVLLTLAYVLWMLWEMRQPEVAMRAKARVMFYLGPLSIIGLWLLYRLIRWDSYFDRTGHFQPPDFSQPRRWYWPWMLLIMGLGFCLSEAKVPLQLAFAWSESELDRLADAAAAEQDASALSCQWAGAFFIREVEVRGSASAVFLRTSSRDSPGRSSQWGRGTNPFGFERILDIAEWDQATMQPIGTGMWFVRYGTGWSDCVLHD